MSSSVIALKSKETILSPTLVNKIPHKWVNNANHYFENESNEYWVATIENKKLLISGLDIEFEVIELTHEEALKERKRLLKALMINEVPMIKDYIITKSEGFWFLSIIESSLEKLI